ncbi:hypothetical protein [Terrarubrum flagellatum]|uniref:hypothetical protein n=1 Tax=Terrirubrum flagellatum TaxID=2895980 RepID=UPI003144F937
MKFTVVAPVCAAFALGLFASAHAQTQTAPAAQPDATAQPAKPKPKPRKDKNNAASVTITNGRTAPLQAFELSTDAQPPVIVAKLSKPLAPGKSATLPIKGKHGCSFDVRGAFADDSTVENDGVNVCKDGKLRLSE